MREIETFYLDRYAAYTFGIELQKPIQFSEPVPIVEKISIPGRSGDLVFDTGAYENRKGIAACFALQRNVQTAIDAANSFLLSSHGYRRLECSNDPEHFWKARVVNGAKIENRLNTLNPFEIEFDCMPQRFLVNGENRISMSESGILFNSYGGDALPFIFVYGTGSGSFSIGNYSVDIEDIGGVLYVDSETQNAYNEVGNQNDKIIAPIFPVLKVGENPIGFSGGIERIEIVPRWWDK